MNDPNGMVHIDGVYHLFYQHFPDGNTWGPMHWGHASSRDLVHWDHHPIALYPDEHGYIYSGSAVYDRENTSGLGSAEDPPLVAIFSYHDPIAEKKGRKDFETQGIAYSLDRGKTWEKFEGNPVLMNPGLRDFRDPKVTWHAATEKWIMALAVKDHVRFYSSPNLIDWKKESEFGHQAGAHDGTWECPDLFEMEVEGSGEKKWVLLVSTNPGGPNGGSATQYFIGHFDGTRFTADHSDIRWVDMGHDNYAGVTWSNVRGRTLFIGWMSNWTYANKVPTEVWRSANTITRELRLERLDDKLLLAAQPVDELKSIETEKASIQERTIENALDLFEDMEGGLATYSMDMELDAESFELELRNSLGEVLVLGFDHEAGEYYIDRRKAGDHSFKPAFGTLARAPRISTDPVIRLKLLVDVSSVELFFDDGLTVMSSLFFPSEEMRDLELIPREAMKIYALRIAKLGSIWNR